MRMEPRLMPAWTSASIAFCASERLSKCSRIVCWAMGTSLCFDVKEELRNASWCRGRAPRAAGAHDRGGAASPERERAAVDGRKPHARREGRLHRAHAPAKPARERPKQKAERAEQRAPRDGPGCRLGRLRRLLLRLVDRLAVLLLVLLDLRARLLDRNVLGPRDGLSCALARVLLLLRVAGDERAHRSNGRVPQGGRVVAARRAAHRLLDRGEGVRHAREVGRGHLSRCLRRRADRAATLPSALVTVRYAPPRIPPTVEVRR